MMLIHIPTKKWHACGNLPVLTSEDGLHPAHGGQNDWPGSMMDGL